MPGSARRQCGADAAAAVLTGLSRVAATVGHLRADPAGCPAATAANSVTRGLVEPVGCGSLVATSAGSCCDPAAPNFRSESIVEVQDGEFQPVSVAHSCHPEHRACLILDHFIAETMTMPVLHPLDQPGAARSLIIGACRVVQVGSRVAVNPVHLAVVGGGRRAKNERSGHRHIVRAANRQPRWARCCEDGPRATLTGRMPRGGWGTVRPGVVAWGAGMWLAYRHPRNGVGAGDASSSLSG